MRTFFIRFIGTTADSGITGTGALSAQDSSISGTGTKTVKSVSGSLQAQDSSISGSGDVTGQDNVPLWMSWF